MRFAMTLVISFNNLLNSLVQSNKQEKHIEKGFRQAVFLMGLSKASDRLNHEHLVAKLCVYDLKGALNKK